MVYPARPILPVAESYLSLGWVPYWGGPGRDRGSAPELSQCLPVVGR